MKSISIISYVTCQKIPKLKNKTKFKKTLVIKGTDT